MSNIKIVTPDTAETIQLGPVSMHILEDGSRTDNRIGTVLSIIPPHAISLPQHLHLMHDETFFVTQGTIRFTVNDEEQDVKAGGYVVVPTGAAHTFSNPSDEPATFLTTFTPAFYVNYFRELAKMASAGKEASADEIMRVRGRYATEPA